MKNFKDQSEQLKVVGGNSILKRPIFILGAHKSGSSLLRSLFDGHPQLFTIPLETHIFKAAGCAVEYRLGEANPRPVSFQEISQNYFDIIARYNERHLPLSDANLSGKFNMPFVKSRLFDNLVPDMLLQSLIEQYVQSIHCGLYGIDLPSNKRVVEKSVEHAEFAQDLKMMFPDAMFVHIIRNPYSHLVSLRLMQGRNTGRQFPYLGKLIATLKNSYYHLYRNRRFISDYLVIRYEDLVASTSHVMKKVSKFVGIDFVDTLLVPTSLGELWEGNSSRGSIFSNVSKENINLWQKQITDLEINYVNGLFDFLLRDYDYEKRRQRKSHWWPVWYESPHIYLANRLIPYEYGLHLRG